MPVPNQNNEAEVLDLSKRDDEIQRQATIQKVLDLEHQNRSHALIQLMLDTYKQKVESAVRKDLEEALKILRT